MGQYGDTLRCLKHQHVSFSDVAGTTVEPVAAGHFRVRVLVTIDAYVRIGPDPTATTDDMFMPAKMPEFFTVSAGWHVSAIAVGPGPVAGRRRADTRPVEPYVGVPGTLHVTEME